MLSTVPSPGPLFKCHSYFWQVRLLLWLVWTHTTVDHKAPERKGCQKQKNNSEKKKNKKQKTQGAEKYNSYAFVYLWSNLCQSLKEDKVFRKYSAVYGYT